MKTYCLYPSFFMDIRRLPSINPETSNVQVTVVDKDCPPRYSPFTKFLDTVYCKSYGTATSKIIMTAAPFPRMPQIYEPLRTFSTGAYLLIPAYTHQNHNWINRAEPTTTIAFRPLYIHS